MRYHFDMFSIITDTCYSNIHGKLFLFLEHIYGSPIRSTSVYSCRSDQ